MNTTLKLISSDGMSFIVSKRAMLKSKTIQSMIDDSDMETDEPIRFNNIESSEVERIVTYIEHYVDDDEEKYVPIECEELEFGMIGKPIITNKWDLDFLDIELDSLVKLMKAADYLSIPSLGDLTAKKVKLVTYDFPVEKVR